MLFRILKGWDLWAAVGVAAVVLALSPSWTETSVVKEIYSVGISVLSIIFAVFFTALAVIMAAGDDDFVLYLRGLGVYEDLMKVFRYTVWLLFVSLFFSVALFVFTVIGESSGYRLQSKWLMVLHSFLFTYAMFSTIGSTHDSFHYARYRLEFLELRSRDQ